MTPLEVVVVLCFLGGPPLAFAGFLLAGNIGVSPVLAYSAGFDEKAGLLQPATPRRVWGARLGLVGLLLSILAVALLLVLVTQGGSASGSPPDPLSP